MTLARNHAAMDSDPRLSYFAITNRRNEGKRFGIKQADRFAHIHIVGKTGAGKSTLLETLVNQDMEAERGYALISGLWDLIGKLVDIFLPDECANYFRSCGYDPD